MTDVFHERVCLRSDEKIQFDKNNHEVLSQFKSRKFENLKLSDENIEPTKYLASFITTLSSNSKGKIN